MPIISVKDNENNWWKRNAEGNKKPTKSLNKDRKKQAGQKL